MNELNLKSGARIEIYSNGRLLIGASVDNDPQSNEETLAILKEIVAMLEAPSIDITDQVI